MFTNKEELAKDVKVSGGFNCSDYETVKFKILKTVNKTDRITSLDLRRTNFGWFRNTSWQDPVGVCTREQKGPGQVVDLQGQPRQLDWAMPVCRKPHRYSRPAWKNRRIFSEDKQNQKIHRRWKLG